MSEKLSRISKKASEVAFIKLIKQYPDVFSKSQTPEARSKKLACLKEIQQRYAKMFHRELSVVQLLKKINNMKTRLKTKMHTSSKETRLKEWEFLLMEIIQPDIPVVAVKRNENEEENDSAYMVINSDENRERELPPHVIEFEEECEVVVEPDIVESSSKSEPSVIPEYIIHSRRLPSPKHQIPVFRRRLKEETEETKHLSTQELKRLVLLKKLRVLNLKEKKLLQELCDDSEELPDSYDHNYLGKFS